jgi:hypothetical protein
LPAAFTKQRNYPIKAVVLFTFLLKYRKRGQ